MGLSRALTQDERAALHFKEELELNPQEAREPVCPAAMAFDGALRPCVLCRVDGSLVESFRSPNTYFGRCTDEGYIGCSTWIADKENEASLRRLQQQQR